MPILYVHGVATRDSSGFEAMTPFLRRYVAPAISSDPDSVSIDKVYWGGLGARFAWEGRSRPRTLLLRQGGAEAVTVQDVDLVRSLVDDDELRTLAAKERPAAAAASAYTSGVSDDDQDDAVRLSRLTDDQLSDVLSGLVQSIAVPEQGAWLAIRADELARDAEFRTALAGASSPEDEAEIVTARLEREAASGYITQGPAWLSRLRDRLSESLSRGRSAPAVAASIVLGELRPWLNDAVSVFMGDVFVYLDGRGTAAAPGAIPQQLLAALDAAWQNKLARGGEPLVVLSHSMGGQLVYDAVSYFLPNHPARRDLKIDFWCATASQVGFFEELKLFALKDAALGYPDKVPFPSAHVGFWWNLWDHNDVLSFTARDIFDGVLDELYHTGASLAGAHSAYFARPSFFRRLARQLTAAAGTGWMRP